MSTNLKTNGSDKVTHIIKIMVAVYVLLMFTVFPIVFRDYYFDILRVKYWFFCVISVILSIGLLIAACYKIGKAYREKPGSWNHTFGGNNKCWKADFSSVLLVIFLISLMISTLQSDYLYESFWGNEGRLMGLFFWILCSVAFFAVSRFFEYKDWYLDAFLAVAFLVCVFGITDYFKLDILGFKKELVGKDLIQFTSTFGNINTYAAYVSMVTAVSTVLFTVSKGYKGILYYISMIVSFFAVIMANSDNAYLALIALFALLPIYLFRRSGGISKYCLVLLSFIGTIQCIDYINQWLPDHVKGVDGLFGVLIRFKYLPFLFIILVLLNIVICGLQRCMFQQVESARKLLQYGWLVVLAIGVAVVGYVLIDANIGNHMGRYSGLENYIVFNDGWGSSRGIAWRLALENYHGFSLVRKLFGYGPETFGILTVLNNYDEMISKASVIFDNAHNEYLQYLLTIGLIGLGSYLGLAGSVIASAFKRIGENTGVIAMMFAVISYMAQAAVTVGTPMVFPIAWIFLSIGLSACREKKNYNIC